MVSRARFRLYALYASAALLLCSLVLPRYYDLPYPKPLEPSFSPEIKRQYLKGISETKPKVVFIGDSILYSLDNAEIARHLGEPTYSIGVPGSATAAWYLALKNEVLAAEHKPEYVVIPFHNTKLTVPELHTTGQYFQVVDDFAGRNEPLTAQLAYVNPLNSLEKAAERYFPLYSARWQLRESLDRQIRFGLAARFGVLQERANAALDSLFDRKESNFAVPTRGPENIYAPEEMNFKKRLGESFLPHIIQLARENGLRLVFVRVPNMVYPNYASEPPSLRRYIAALSAYLSAQQGVTLIDLAYDERMKPEYFEEDGVHFTLEGRAVFVQILAEALKPIVR